MYQLMTFYHHHLRASKINYVRRSTPQLVKLNKGFTQTLFRILRTSLCMALT